VSSYSQDELKRPTLTVCLIGTMLAEEFIAVSVEPRSGGVR
jgi:hypothetical protein